MRDNASDRPAPSICFVAHYAYGAMSGGASGHIGGVERQQTVMARWLTKRGYPVGIITWDEGQPDGEVIDGVRVFKVCRKNAGLPGLRFLWPRWTSLRAALARADAEVYYQNCAEYVTGQVAMWCRKRGRTFVYSVANDPECDPGLPTLNTLRERWLYRHGLRHADQVVVQSRLQQRMLRNGFGLESTVIPMPCPGPGEGDYDVPTEPPAGRRVLWIGRICEQKRPDRLVQIAKACPDITFDMVGPIHENDYARQTVAAARATPNITVHGPMPRDRVSECYKAASCLLSTSDFEGFPNTFLEAWSYGLPVIATVDTDELLTTSGLGELATNTDGLIAAVRRTLNDAEHWRAMSARARTHYLENHTVESVMPRFERVFAAAVNSRASEQDKAKR